jgi:hypothetical protein
MRSMNRCIAIALTGSSAAAKEAVAAAIEVDGVYYIEQL